MGISELEAVMFGVAGAILISHFYPKELPRQPGGYDLFGLLVLLLGIFLLGFALLDVFVDHN